MTQLTKEMFLKSVSKSKMTIINDDGLNKYLRFSDDDSGQIFEVVTWINHLVITGTMGTAVFSGVLGSAFSSTMDDMFSSLKSNDLEIDIEDFSKSMVSVAVDDYKEFSFSRFEEAVTECFNRAFEKADDELLLEKDNARSSLNKMLLLCRGRSTYGEYCMCLARDWAYSYGKDFIELVDFGYTEDYSYPTHRHIWRLYAIVWAIQQYDLSKVNKQVINNLSKIKDIKDYLKCGRNCTTQVDLQVLLSVLSERMICNEKYTAKDLDLLIKCFILAEVPEKSLFFSAVLTRQDALLNAKSKA